LENRLTSKGKKKELQQLHEISNMAKFAFVRQQVPMGDGHAILSALPFIGLDEPVVVLFGDDIFDAPTPVTRQLMDTYERYRDPVIALCDVGKANVSKYGIAGGKTIAKNIMELDGFVEKPTLAEAPSTFAAVGRYVVTPEILHLLRTQKGGRDGEI